eukprot:scaffold7729_cov471-Prasinococcus_capsulatus_cf.AAC.3
MLVIQTSIRQSNGRPLLFLGELETLPRDESEAGQTLRLSAIHAVGWYRTLQLFREGIGPALASSLALEADPGLRHLTAL